MEYLFLLMLVAGVAGLCYGFWLVSVKMFLWTVEPLTEWFEKHWRHKGEE